MRLKQTMFFFLLVLLSQTGLSQHCSSKGQTPASAITICKDNAVLTQAAVPHCSTNPIWVPVCSNKDDYADYTPMWYTFTCYSAGTFGFIIDPVNTSDDYNWALFDVTGHPLKDIFTKSPNATLVISSNWSGSSGPTGATPSGLAKNQCYSAPADNATTFNFMPQLEIGHTYYLMVSHPLNTVQSGYQLSIQGGNASIANTIYPTVNSAVAYCSGQTIVVKLNKEVTCASISPDGSDFDLNPPLASVIAAEAFSCYTAFGGDSITLNLNHAVPAGNYTVTVKKGSDGNTLTDFCDQQMNEGASVPVVIDPVFPIKMDSISPFGCAANELYLIFSKGVRCGSVAANGSDFIITGTNPPPTILSAYGLCDHTGLSNKVRVTLTKPMLTKGNYNITLVKGTDNNTLLDECGLAVTEGSSLTFSSKDTVNADFGYRINWGCVVDTINFFYETANDVNNWLWNFDDKTSSILQNPQVLYDTFGTKRIKLTVSNGTCNATSPWISVFLGNDLKAAFDTDSTVCPGDLTQFKEHSIGNIVAWNWTFGNGNTSVLRVPPAQSYTIPNTITEVTAQLVVQNDIGCQSTATKKMLLFNECYAWVPTAFTPNNDGINDYLYPLNAEKFTGIVFRVYNRYGKLVFQSNRSDVRWDGKFGGQPTEPGTYIWILQYTNIYSGRRVEKKGSTVLMR